LLFVTGLVRWPERLVMVLSAERSCSCLLILIAGWRGGGMARREPERGSVFSGWK